MRILKLPYILLYIISTKVNLIGNIKASSLEIGEQVASTISSTNQIKVFTPLYKEAQSFLEVWNDMKIDEIDRALIKYIDDTIAEDQYQNFPALQQIPIVSHLQNLEFIKSGKQEDKLKTSLNDINYLYQKWCAKDLLDNNSPNAFASYFLGYFLSPLNSDLNGSALNSTQFKNFLDDASKKYYARATNLLLNYLSWRKDSVTNSTLQIRNSITNEPADAILEFIKSHNLRGQVKWEDISNLKNALYSISTNQAQYDYYIKLHKNLSDELKNILILRIKKETSWRIDVPIILNSLGTGVLSLTTGINNIILHTNPTMFTIGIIQTVISAPQFLAGVINIPHVYDLAFTAQQNNLLPSSYGNEEISIQSYIIALLGVINNKEVNFSLEQNHNFEDKIDKDGEIKLDLKKVRKYAHHLSYLILQNYQDEEKSLISIIDDKTQDQLEYKQ